jgi:D-alanyl-D-alanine carboxypeptidase
MPLQTENGWYQIDSSQCDKSTIPGTNIWVPLQAGRVSRIMKAFCADYHQYVEPLRQFDIGGWTPTNSVWNSNHLSGSAMDLCWQLHPFGKRGTFSAAKLLVIRELLDYYEKWIYWAGEWKSVADEMHWQMGYSTYGRNADMDDFIKRKIKTTGFSRFRRADLPPLNRKPVVPAEGGTYWADVSQYQGIPFDASYPYNVICFRTNSGSAIDTLAEANIRNVRDALAHKQIDLAIAYYFFRPGEENCDLHRKLLRDNGLWGHPRLVSMVDVEGDAGRITGDNSWEINDEIERLRQWHGDPKRVVGYWNPNADPGLWPSRPYGLGLVIPQYSSPRSARRPGDLSTVKDRNVYAEAIAHQYTDAATNVAPWTGRNVDMNWAPYSIEELLNVLGVVGDSGSVPVPVPPTGDVEIPEPVPAELLSAIGAQFNA